jgi:hypothetical protein
MAANATLDATIENLPKGKKVNLVEWGKGAGEIRRRVSMGGA